MDGAEATPKSKLLGGLRRKQVDTDQVKVCPWGQQWEGWPQRRNDDGDLEDIYEDDIRNVVFVMPALDRPKLQAFDKDWRPIARSVQRDDRGGMERGINTLLKKYVRDWEDVDGEEVEPWLEAREEVAKFLAQNPELMVQLVVAYSATFDASIEKKIGVSGAF